MRSLALKFAIHLAIKLTVIQDAEPTDYGRCLQVAGLLGEAANKLDSVGRFTLADSMRDYALAVTHAGRAL